MKPDMTASKVVDHTPVWPYGIGPGYIFSHYVKKIEGLKPGQVIYFEMMSREKILIFDANHRNLGEILDERALLKLRHTLEKKQEYVAEVRQIVPANNLVQIQVSWPSQVVAFSEPLLVVFPKEKRTKLENILRRNKDLEGYDLNNGLSALFTYRSNYLVMLIDVDQSHRLLLLSPYVVLVCEIKERTHLIVVDVEKSDHDLHAKFEKAGLIRIGGGVSWLSAESSLGGSINAAFDLIREVRNEKGEYFSIWQKYEEAQEQFLRDRAARLKPLEYTRYKQLESVFRFYLEKEKITNNIDAWMDYGGNLSVELRFDDPADEESQNKSIALGNIRKITKEFIDVDIPDIEFGLPSDGWLVVSERGDQIQYTRQRAALNRLLTGMATLPNLQTILSTGLVDDSYEDNIPFSRTHSTFLVDGTRPNRKQEDAIRYALNTDDICVIQGPPGTGKTSVIRTILRRLKDEGARHLLVTSHQHIAVDNVLSGMQKSGVIAYRLGGNSSSEDYRDREIDQWSDQVREKVLLQMKELPAASQQDRANQKLLDFAQRALDSGLTIAESVLFVRKSLADFQELIPSLLASEARLLLASGEDIASRLLKQPIINTHISQITEILASLPENVSDMNANHSHDLNKLPRLLRELDRSGAYAVHDYASLEVKINQIRRFIDRKEYLQSTELLIGTEQTRLEDVLSSIQGIQEHLPSESAAVPIVPEDVREWNVKFKRWCRELIVLLEKNQIQSKYQLSTILDNWAEVLENRPLRVQRLLKKHADVWGITCQQTVAKRYELYDEEFDYVIVDEAARTSPLDLIIPLVRARRIILVGDQNQLPHILDYELEKLFRQSNAEDKKIQVLKDSLFARLYQKLPSRKRIRLNIQYRMNPVIGNLVSQCFYQDDPLENDPSTFELVNDTGMFEGKSLVWSDVAPDGDAQGFESGQYYNIHEKDRVLQLIKQIVQNNPKNYSIGVITFYAQQRDLIEQELRNRGMRGNVQVGTVDAFQGEQKDIVLLSMVRSNKQRNIGFLASPNRLNVAFSRARRILVMVGDSSTVKSDRNISLAYQCCKEYGHVVSEV